MKTDKHEVIRLATPEGRIEDYFLKRCRENGILCWKFTSPSQNGVPDRILMYKGQTIFVELKAPGEEPRPDQKAVHRLMAKQGITVLVSDDDHVSDEIIDRLLAYEFIPRKPRSKRARNHQSKSQYDSTDTKTGTKRHVTDTTV